MRWADRTRGVADGQRIRLLVARFLGVGFVAYLVVSVVGVGEGARILAWWWTPLALVLTFVPGLALLLATYVAPQRIPLAAGLAAIGLPLAAVLWPLAWNGDVLHGAARSTWLSAMSGIAGLCAALVWRPAVAFVVQFVASTTIAAIDQLGLFGSNVSVPDVVFAATWAFGLSAVLTTAVIVALRTAAILDATRESLERTAADAAAAQAREHEKARFDALIHDRVLATLLGTTRPDADGRIAAEARSALLELDRAVEHPGRDGAVSAEEFVEQLKVVVSEASHSASMSVSVDDDLAVYPDDVFSAVSGATAEALRNSIMHAGVDATRHVVVALRRGVARVIVTDTGCGFDTAAVGKGRLGIDVSIVGRMAKLDGGSSDVRSDRGQGTTVELEWTEPS
ncbi:sensor histidine kinase [Rhodococcoides kyotonense]|uniref:Signal transduction histidine kinase n=1 Tax=Rhodococcoides kyotonense TaxID=398843 RepID=A0A239KE30_9NOCA|nr:ATP-binding protein [Rhodococcus kyotonensis]SNT16607.1 Signal transduction histidine kinase [Rhodococcus kyotonensis]